MKFEWENIFSKEMKDLDGSMSNNVQRAKVPGGWIVKSFTATVYHDEFMVTESMVFVRNDDQDWTIDKRDPEPQLEKPE